jgi:hypothetical protein
MDPVIIFSEALESIRMKQLIALIMIAFLVPTAAMAKNNACTEDKTKFCKDAKASGKKVKDCLKEHISEVSAACKESLEKPEAATAAKPAEAAKPATPASPGAAETKP